MSHLSIEQIDAHADGAIPPQSAARVTAHLAGCAACADAVADRRALREAMNALPDTIEPPPELWLAVHARVNATGSDVASRARVRPSGSPGRRALIGAAVVAVVIGGAALARHTNGDNVPAFADRWQPTLQPWDVTPASVSPADLARYRQQLAVIVDEESHSLSTATMATLRRNLAVIDAAIREIETALARDPQSASLRGRLLRAYQTQSALVRLAWQAS